MDTILAEILLKYVDNWEENVVYYGVYENKFPNTTKTTIVYYFTVLNGAFSNETKQFKFEYFTELNKSEVIKFVFRSLASVDCNYDFINNKFKKRFICY